MGLSKKAMEWKCYDFLFWKYSTEVELRKAGVWNIVNKEKLRPAPSNPNCCTESEKEEMFAWDSEQSKAWLILIDRLSSKYEDLVLKNQKSFKIWEGLDNLFIGKSGSYRRMLMEKLKTAKMEEGETMKDHTDFMTKLFSELECVGVSFPQSVQIDFLLLSLPRTEENDEILSSIESSLDFSDFKEAGLDEVVKRLICLERYYYEGVEEEKFEGHRYLDFKCNVELDLKICGLWSIVTKKSLRPTPKDANSCTDSEKKEMEDWDRDECKAWQILVKSLTSEFDKRINLFRKSYEIWEDLDKKFLDTGFYNRKRLMKLLRFHLGEEVSMTDHIDYMSKLCGELEAAGDKMDDNKQITSLLMPLMDTRAEYQVVMRAMDARVDKKWTWSEVVRMLIDAESDLRLAREREESKFAKTPSDLGDRKYKSDRRCYYCSKTGHVKKNCWMYLADKVSGNVSPSCNNFTYN